MVAVWITNQRIPLEYNFCASLNEPLNSLRWKPSRTLFIRVRFRRRRFFDLRKVRKVPATMTRDLRDSCFNCGNIYLIPARIDDSAFALLQSYALLKAKAEPGLGTVRQPLAR